MHCSTIRRGVATAALLVATVGTIGTGTALAQNGYHVNTAGAPLTVRTGPGTGYRAAGSLPDGTPVDIACQATGTYVDGTYGRSNVWDRIGTGRFVADSYVWTGHDGQFLRSCDGTQGLRDDYPYRGQHGVDRWNYYIGQCTSFVAWRINDRLHIAFNNYYRGQHWGNANTWDDAARALGIAVNDHPAVGAVAQWNSGSYGHVAWVTRVNSGGTVTIEEYNYSHSEAYDYRTIPVSAVENFVHLP